MSNPDKLPDVLSVVRECIEAGRYLDSRHAFQRQAERDITRPEMLFVLRNGHHEKRKDKFDGLYQAWNYAIRGRTLDRKDLRIIVSFETAAVDELMLIITAIEIKK